MASAATCKAGEKCSNTFNTENLTNLDEIKAAYDKLCVDEEEITADLDKLLQDQYNLNAKVQELNKLSPRLGLLDTDAAQLSGMISFTSTLADNVSSKVRQLDIAKSRVSESLQRVEDILDLKFCTDGVQAALQNEDYEQAAAHIHRFLSLDENLLRHTADEGGQLDMAFSLLHEATNKLISFVRKEFDDAVANGDVASIERFFKIFPLLNLHEEGLRKFSAYLCSKIADTANKNLISALATDANDKRASVIFADTITLLFEGAARIVEIHQPLVETYYGPGKMLIFMQSLQKECDLQALKIIAEFRSFRQFDQKHKQIGQSKNNVVEKLDARDLDVLLAEVTLLNARAELYFRFVKRRVQSDIDAAAQDETANNKLAKELEQFINGSDLSRCMQELLGCYISMEEYFMRESVLKAVSMDYLEDDCLTSSMLDDVFFIIKKSISRAVQSSNVDVVCAMLNHACIILEQDYRDVLYEKLRAGFPSGLMDFQQAYTVFQSSLQQGKLSDTDKARLNFLTTLNNTVVSIEHLKTLKTSLQADFARQLSQMSEQAKAKLDSCLSDLGSVSSKFKSALDYGVNQVHKNAVKPRVKPWIESFVTVSHCISEAEFSNYEANDPFVQGLIVNIDGLLESFKSSLTSDNYDQLITLLTSEVASQLEKYALRSSFNRLGGLQFDKELRSLTGYLTSKTPWTLRDKFARLTQIATILNQERVAEILDYWGPNSGPLTWRLTPTEVRQVLALRIDFREEDIKRLKL